MPILFDASSLINLIKGAVFELILALPQIEFLVGPIVLQECVGGDDVIDAVRGAADEGRVGVLDDSEIKVSSGASPATANPTMRDALWQEMRIVARETPGANERWVAEQYFAQKVGPRNLKHILPDNPSETDASIINDAMVENDMLARQIAQIVDPMDDHVVHIEVHLQPLTQIAQSGERRIACS